MTVSAIGHIAGAVFATELAACILSRKFIYQKKSYTRAVIAFEKAKARYEKTVASVATKQSQQLLQNDKKSQKSIDKDTKQLEWQEEEMKSAAADVARHHTSANFYQSIAFLLLYRVLATEYVGQVVAVLPFVPPSTPFPFSLFRKMSFRGLTFPEEYIPVSTDVKSPSQACAFVLIYMLCSFSIKLMVNMIAGTKPPKGADAGVGNLIDSKPGKQLMEKLGMNSEELEDARKVLGF
jgi:uncharacterized membrane protein (DUF106 family)